MQAEFQYIFSDPPAPFLFQDGTRWQRYRERDVIPMWVADMDFKSPQQVLDALQQRVAHGVFGYGQPWPGLIEAVQNYLWQEYGWKIESDWLVWLPGLVSGINIACRAIGEIGDAVLTTTPIYPPFLSAPKLSGRRVVEAPLVCVDERWGWDFAATDALLRTSKARLLLLCHPHNPVGRVWEDSELTQIAALVEKYDLTVLSDEVHCDLILQPTISHRPFSCLGENMAQRTITLLAPSKVFNLAGLGCAFAIIPNGHLRKLFHAAMAGIVPHVNTLGLYACEAALRYGGAWRSALLEVLRSNAAQVANAINSCPGLSMAAVEATFLAWIDARGMGIEHPQRYFENAGVGFSEGADFHAPGFIRMNFGCAPKLLRVALERIERACSSAVHR